MNWIVFSLSDPTSNETAYNAMNARIETALGIPNETTLRWSVPTPHPTQEYIAIPVPPEAESILTSEEQAALESYEALQAKGWFVRQMVPQRPWWGFLVFWK